MLKKLLKSIGLYIESMEAFPYGKMSLEVVDYEGSSKSTVVLVIRNLILWAIGLFLLFGIIFSFGRMTAPQVKTKCSDFKSQREAQEAYLKDPIGLSKLDKGGRPAVACEIYPYK